MLVSDLYCPSCRNAKDHKPQDNEVCWSCVAMGGAGNYKESKTNADRIRSMSDEKLAVFIRDQIIDRNIGIPSEAWLDWLRQETQE